MIDYVHEDLNKIGEFKDKEAEARYYTFYIRNTQKIMTLLLVALPVIHILMFLLNLPVMGFGSELYQNLAIRIVFIVPSLVLFFLSQNSAFLKKFGKHFFVYVFFAFFHYQLIIIINHSARFDQQAMSFFLGIMLVFIAPTRWIHDVILSIVSAVSFLLCYKLLFNDAPAFEYIQYLVYFSVGIFVLAYFSLNLNIFRRSQFSRENQLELQSSTDSLTGAYNRRFFDKAIHHLLLISEEGQTFSLIMFDLDNFKELSDSRGHTTSDAALISTTRLIKSLLRETDTLARWSGDKFSILLPDIGTENAIMIAQRLCVEVEDYFKDGYGFTASFGISCYQPGDTIDDIISRADRGLYEAKKRGRNQVVSIEYPPPPDTENQSSLS